MKGHVKVGWHLSDEQKENLRLLLVVVEGLLADGVEVDDDTPEYVALLDSWEATHPPWNLMPPVKAYHCHGGEWLTDGADGVVRALWQHVGDTSAALAAYRREIGRAP